MIAGCHRCWIIFTLPYQSFPNSLGSSPFFHGRVNGTSVYLYFIKRVIENLYVHIRISYSLVNKELCLKVWLGGKQLVLLIGIYIIYYLNLLQVIFTECCIFWDNIYMALVINRCLLQRTAMSGCGFCPFSFSNISSYPCF